MLYMGYASDYALLSLVLTLFAALVASSVFSPLLLPQPPLGSSCHHPRQEPCAATYPEAFLRSGVALLDLLL